MPKITGGTADISTEFRVAPPCSYNVKIESVTAKKSRTNKPMIVVTTTILDEVGPDGSSVKGIMMIDNFTLETNEGGRNEAALRAFKRVVEQTLGKDRADDPDFDTDELVGWQGLADVAQETYTKDGETEERHKNIIKRYQNG